MLVSIERTCLARQRNQTPLRGGHYLNTIILFILFLLIPNSGKLKENDIGQEHGQWVEKSLLTEDVLMACVVVNGRSKHTNQFKFKRNPTCAFVTVM